MQVDVGQATILAGIFLANIGALVGFFVSLKVSIAVLNTQMAQVNKDLNNIGALYRNQTSKKDV